VDRRDDDVLLTGPAVKVFEGSLDTDWAAGILESP
jgi:hypothetical protein